MNDNVTPIRTRIEIVAIAADAENRAYGFGFSKGEIVGENRERARRSAAVGNAIMLGFMFGVAAATTVVALAIGWPS